MPISKVFKTTFKPVNPIEARQSVKNDNFTIFENNFNLEKKQEKEDRKENKAKILGGQFLCSKAFDNSTGPDWTKKTHKERFESVQKNGGIKRGNTLKTTGDAFITGGNRYDQHLTDFNEMPRLSILNNYKRIKQIMNTNYVKGFAIEQKYRNRTKQDSDQDPEWAKYKEEK